MNIETIKRYSLVEIVLLVVFMMGMLIASLIVKQRAKVLLSDPLPLFGSGLSVFMPANPGWEYTPAWQYEESESSMTLIGQYRNPGRGKIEVQWRYILNTPAGSEQELLTQRVRDTGAVISGLETVGQANPMTFARMVSGTARDIEEFYLGIIRLDYSRSIELLVKSSGINNFYEETIFKSLAAGIQYQTPKHLADGHALINAFLKSQSPLGTKKAFPDEAFLIKDAQRDAVLGFYSTTHSLSAGDGQTLQQSCIRQFEYRNLTLNSLVWFNPLKKKYRWKTDLIYPGITQPQLYEIEADDTGTLTVKRDIKDTKTFLADPFFLPEPFLSELARYFLQSDSSEVVVDVLGFRGELVPVYLEKIPLEKVKAKLKNADTAVRIVYLHIRNSYEELFFDQSRNLVGKLEQQPGRRGRVWDAVPIEELQRIFQMDVSTSNETVAIHL
jgi:hypothetical protein